MIQRASCPIKIYRWGLFEDARHVLVTNIVLLTLKHFSLFSTLLLKKLSKFLVFFSILIFCVYKIALSNLSAWILFIMDFHTDCLQKLTSGDMSLSLFQLDVYISSLYNPAVSSVPPNSKHLCTVPNYRHSKWFSCIKRTVTF